MYLVVLIAFVVALTLADMSPLVTGRWLLLPAMAVYLAGAVALGAFRTALSLRAIAGGCGAAPRALRRHNVLSVLAQTWLVAGLAGVILAGYGQYVRQDLRLAWVPLAGEIALLAPFFVALLGNWVLEYPFYRAMRARIAQQQVLTGAEARAGWTRREFLGYNLRHHFLFVAVPIALIVLGTDALRLVEFYRPGRPADILVIGGSAAWAGAVFLCAPLLIVRIWRTARLPDGPLRDDLLRSCREMRLRCRDLLVWRSGGMIANAAVMGLVARVRYVLLSDALLEQMDEREVKAIFAHEAGHIVSHHLLYGMMFAISSVALCSTVTDLVAAALALDDWAAQAVALGLLAVAWAVGFGWLSRRFERQSDVIAAWSCAPDGPDAGGRITAEGAAVFAHALQHVAQLNGISPHQRNWRHGSIAHRAAYVMWLGSTGGSRGRIDRVVRRIKAALWAAVALSAAVVAARLTWNV